jgi:hypothetical protein
MINLLPDNYAVQIKYGRRNTTLRRWLLFTGLAIIGLLLIIGGGWLYMDNQARSLQSKTLAGQESLEAQNLPKVQKDAAEISGDVTIINQVLGREIDFSSLMQDIGKVMPPGTVLDGLTLSKIDGPLNLGVSATDYASATQVAVNLGDPKNNLFSSVDIVSINCGGGSSSAGTSSYKCKASFNALFRDTAKARYLGTSGEKK